MAKQGEDAGEKLDMEHLDKIVGGASSAPTAPDDKTKKLQMAEVATFAEASSTVVAPPKIVTMSSMVANEAPLISATNSMASSIAMVSNFPGEHAGKLLSGLITDTATTLKSAYPGLDSETATAMAWSTAYKAIYDADSTGKVRGASDAVKSLVVTHSADIARGFAAEVGYTGDLKASLAHTSDALAQTLKGASATAAEEIKSKASAAYELGLNTAKNTGVGKSVMAAIDDPKNLEAWKTAMGNIAFSVTSPSWATPIKFLAGAMADQATAKAIGLGDFPSEMKQTARAIVNAFDGVEKAFVDIYSSGFLVPLTFGFDVKGIINIGKHCGELGDAMVKGNTSAMASAAQALVTDMALDFKDGMVKYYYEMPTKAFNWTKDVTIKLMDDLGATPYINTGVAAMKTAFTEFGDAAKKGSQNAINVLADFAKHDVAGALSTVENLAKSGVGKAISTLEDVAKSGVRGAITALNEVVKLPNAGAAIDSLARLVKDNVPGALNEVAKAAATVEGATWALRKAAEQGSTAALNEVTNLARTASGNFQRICVDGVKDAVTKGIPGAVDKMAGLIESDVKWARDSAQALIGQGGQAAQQLLDKCETLYGKAAGATAVVEWAAKYAANEVGRSAVAELHNIAKQGGAYAGQAIDSLSNVMRAGGPFADRAWDAVANVAETVGAQSTKAIATMEGFAKAGGLYASQSFDSLKRVAEGGGKYATQAIDGISSVARSGTVFANQAIDELKKLSSTAESAKRALEGVARDVGGYAQTAWDETRKTAEKVIDKINPTKW